MHTKAQLYEVKAKQTFLTEAYAEMYRRIGLA